MAGKAEGELGLKISGFQSALNKATHLMKEFGEHAKETAAQAGEQLRDIAKETGGGKIANMLGLGGAAVAVTAFSAAVVETLKKAGDAIKPALDELTAALPKMTILFDSLGVASKGAIQVLEEMGGLTEKGLDELQTAGSDTTKALYDLQHGGLGSGAYDAAVANPNADLPGPRGKPISLETLEHHAAIQSEKLAKIAAQFDALASGGG